MHFLRDVYYGVLPEEGLVQGYAAYLGDTPIGFLATTRDANGFLETALRRRWRTVAAIVIRHPPSPRALWNAVRVGGDRQRQRERVSEMLSLGVLAPDRVGLPSAPRRRDVAIMLLNAACQHVPPPWVACVDETNVPTKRMYEQLGWTASGYQHAGWPVTQIVYRREGPPPCQLS
jgi:hypothetical protein